MSRIEVTFDCGHRVEVPLNPDSAPVCACGERRIRRSFAPAPRFRGAVLPAGCGTPANLEPQAVSVAAAGPLPLKEGTRHGD